MILFGVWEPSLTAFFSRRLIPGDIFVDVGSNIGYYALLASRLVGNAGRVFAFEACPAIYRDLIANLALNDAANVVPINVAVGSQEGISELYLGPKGNRGLTTLVPRDDFVRQEQTVPVMPLNKLLNDQDLRRVRMFKIDVEGSESAVLAPLAALIDHLTPEAEIALELWPNSTKALEPFFDAGFNVFAVENRYDLRFYWRHHAEAPRRIRSFPTSKVDVILSRRNDEYL